MKRICFTIHKEPTSRASIKNLMRGFYKEPDEGKGKPWIQVLVSEAESDVGSERLGFLAFGLIKCRGSSQFSSPGTSLPSLANRFVLFYNVR